MVVSSPLVDLILLWGQDYALFIWISPTKTDSASFAQKRMKKDLLNGTGSLKDFLKHEELERRNNNAR